jgi:hypothetical protein
MRILANPRAVADVTGLDIGALETFIASAKAAGSL